MACSFESIAATTAAGIFAGPIVALDEARGARLHSGSAEAENAALEAAIAAANAAWPVWRSKTAKERSTLMRKWFDLLIAHTEDLARLMTDAAGAADCERLAARRQLNDWTPRAGLWARLQTTDRGCAGDRAADAAEQTGQQAAETAAAAPSTACSRN